MKRHRKSYYEGGVYIDTTTGRKYKPIGKCCICGQEYDIQIHHYISQNRCFNDLDTVKTRTPKTLTQEQINEKQKLFELCHRCHACVHNLDEDRFFEFFGVKKSKFLYKD